MLRGAGTALNVATVLVGSGLGVALRGRLPERTRRTVTDALGLVTLVIGGLNVADGLGSATLGGAVGSSAGLLVVLGALVVGGSPAACCAWRTGWRAAAHGCSSAWRGAPPRVAPASSRGT